MGSLDLHEKFEPLFKTADDPDDGIRYVLMEGGRGAAKSFAVGTWVNHISYNKGWKVLYSRYNMTSANVSIIPEFLEKSGEDYLDNEDDFYVVQGQVTNQTTDVDILFKGLSSSTGKMVSLKSINAVNIWIIDEAEELHDYDLFDKIDNSIRTKKHKNIVVLILNPTDKTHWIYSYFYKEELDGTITKHRDDTLYIKTSYLDNLEHLNESFINKAEKLKLTDPDRYEHIFMGAWTSKVEGALWDYDLINSHRRRADELGAYKKIVVAIDPAVTSAESSDETAIVVAGMKFDKTFDILESVGGQYTPRQWALKALSLYDTYQASWIVGEVNNGGDLIEENLKNSSKNRKFKYIKVTASRGKLVRAEPVQALYDDGVVFHTKYFTRLEKEMISYTGDKSEVSPNRMDSLVWAMFQLAGLSRKVNYRGWKKDEQD